MSRAKYVQYPLNVSEDLVYKFLTAIKENDGFVLESPSKAVRDFIIPTYATVEVSPHIGMDIQWHLTSAGRSEMKRIFGRRQRRSKLPRSYPYSIQRGPVVSLTIEVLDALKAIMDTGEPQTDKLDIVARIQLGKYAECDGGVWRLTNAGKYQAQNHIRKSECAQFSGKVR
jgi:hypothetical protein